MQFDSFGRLKIVSNPILTVRATGSIVAEDVSEINFSGSFLNAVKTAEGIVNVSYTPNAPIMALSGFRASTTPSEQNYYQCTASGFFVGDTSFMCSVLYCVPWQEIRTQLAGVSDGNYTAGNNWLIADLGLDFATPNVGSVIDFVSIEKTAGFPYWGKWHVATMYKAGTELGIFLDGGGGLVTVGGAATPAWHTAISFSIGVANNGNGTGIIQHYPALISAVALRTGSYVSDAPTISSFHEQVVRDGDIRQHTGMGFDHIWSVKQNTPGATWRDAVGAFHLNRSGTLSIITQSNPRWA